jgi:hypothetical protein
VHVFIVRIAIVLLVALAAPEPDPDPDPDPIPGAASRSPSASYVLESRCSDTRSNTCIGPLLAQKYRYMSLSLSRSTEAVKGGWNPFITAAGWPLMWGSFLVLSYSHRTMSCLYPSAWTTLIQIPILTQNPHLYHQHRDQLRSKAQHPFPLTHTKRPNTHPPPSASSIAPPLNPNVKLSHSSYSAKHSRWPICTWAASFGWR